MNNKKYYWLKFQQDFFKSLRIKKLRRLAGGDTFTIIYLKLQLLSLSTNGVLEYKGIFESFAEEMSEEIDEDVENIEITLQYLLSCGLMEQTDDKYFLPYVEENTGSESKSAERVRNFREKQKALHCNADVTKCNVTVTQCNTEKEKEKEKELEIEKDICAFPSDFDFEKAWEFMVKDYPKKRNIASAKTVWLNKLMPIIPENKKFIASVIHEAELMFISDHKKKNPDDTTFKFVPTLDKWLVEECDYWCGFAEDVVKERKMEKEKNNE